MHTALEFSFACYVHLRSYDDKTPETAAITAETSPTPSLQRNIKITEEEGE